MANQPLAETPPSTELMTKVMGEAFGNGKHPIIYEGVDGEGRFVWLSPSQVSTKRADPRTDLVEAMKLLGWLYFEHEIDFQIDTIWKDNQHVTGWGVGDLEDQDYHIIPLTGLPFCTATCNLAAKCLGLSEGGA